VGFVCDIIIKDLKNLINVIDQVHHIVDQSPITTTYDTKHAVTGRAEFFATLRNRIENSEIFEKLAQKPRSSLPTLNDPSVIL